MAAVSANTVLVMIDGRAVYSPRFTGVFWNALDDELEDIDRIEVIRGPAQRCGGRTPSTASSTSSRAAAATRLVVDDHADARDLLQLTLSAYGADVVSVDSAAEAMAQIDRQLPDVVLSDVGMPREDVTNSSAAYARAPSIAVALFRRSPSPPTHQLRYHVCAWRRSARSTSRRMSISRKWTTR